MSALRMFRYSVVVPVYRNAESLPEVVARLAALAGARVGRLEAVFVVDGSPDDSLHVLRRVLASGQLEAQIISLSRNFGSFSAIRAGMAVARGDFIAVMAADLQEPVEVVAGFFDKLEHDECDIVFGERVDRADPAMSSMSSRVYWWLYRRFVNSEIPVGGVDVFGCSREISRQIVEFRETHTSLVGLLFWVGHRRAYVPYKRVPRHSGRSGWTARRKLRYLFDSVYAFTDLPVILLQLVGAIGVALSTLVGLIVFIAWAMGAIQQPGYTPLMIALMASTSAILLGLGVVGSYVWRAYENGKGRPIALTASHEFYEAAQNGTSGEPLVDRPAAIGGVR
jgi:glycosyltransferase involved in cell wall biosynthesis